MKQLRDIGERNDDGELIATFYDDYQKLKTKEVNVSKLTNPGKRTTNDVSLLVIEARLDAEKGVPNPAFPSDGDIASEATKRIVSNGHEPAWKDRDPAVYI